MTNTSIREPKVGGTKLVLTYLTHHEMQFMIPYDGYGRVSSAIDQATRQLTSGVPGVVAESIRFRLTQDD